MVKNLPSNAGQAGSISGSGRSPREGNGNPLQHSCLGNPIDREAWRVSVLGVTKETMPAKTEIHSVAHALFCSDSYHCALWNSSSVVFLIKIASLAKVLLCRANSLAILFGVNFLHGTMWEAL